MISQPFPPDYSVATRVQWEWPWDASSARDAEATFQQPGSPLCPQQFCLRTNRRQRLRESLASFSGQGIGWFIFVRKSESDGSAIENTSTADIGLLKSHW